MIRKKNKIIKVDSNDLILLKKNPKAFWDKSEVIDDYAFDGLSDLIEITIPKNINVIYPNAFYNCNNLIKVVLERDISNIDFEEKVDLSKSFSVLFPEFKDEIINIHAVNMGSEKDIRDSFFLGCNNLKKIVITSNKVFKEFEIQNEEKFEHILKENNYLIIVSEKNKNLKHLQIIKNDVNNCCSVYINSKIYEEMKKNRKIRNLVKWCFIKNGLNSNNIKKAPIPQSYIILGLIDNPDMIEKYYNSNINGFNIIEKQVWFKNLDYEIKVNLVKFFAMLGGFENNTKYKTDLVNFFNNLAEFNNDKKIILNEKLKVLNALDLKPFLINQREKAEYVRDENNKVILENGIPKLKRHRNINFNIQLLKFFETYYKDEKFLDSFVNIAYNFANIVYFYKRKLTMTNKKDLKEYENLIKTGIDLNISLSFLTEKKFQLKNIELGEILSSLPKNNAIDQDIANKYDEYLSKAKEIIKKSIINNTRNKVFINVNDNFNGKYTYKWPPITSTTTLTIGAKLDTCYRVGDRGEPSLEAVIEQPKDSIMLIYDGNDPCAYCRVNYDSINKGILIEIIELDKFKYFDDNERLQIWKACERGLKDMQSAMNKEGKFPVERINCKPDPCNRLLNIIFDKFFKVKKINAKILEERHYVSTNEMEYKEFYTEYCKDLEQIVITSPELHNEYTT